MGKSKKKNKGRNMKNAASIKSLPLPVKFVMARNSSINREIKSLSTEGGTLLRDLYTNYTDSCHKTNIAVWDTILITSLEKHLIYGFNKEQREEKIKETASNVISLIWSNYGKVMYKVSKSLFDYIDDGPIPENYIKLIENVPQKNVYIDLSKCEVQDYYGKKITGAFVNIGYIIEEHSKEKVIETVVTQTGVNDFHYLYTQINQCASTEVTPSNAPESGWSRWFNTTILKILLYMSIVKPSEFEIKNKQTKPNKGGKHQDYNTIDLGECYKEGTVFDPHKTKKTVYEGQKEEPVKTGAHMPPHVCSGHWRTYWTGKGRTVPVQKFVKEYLVNCEDASKLPTVGRKIKEE